MGNACELVEKERTMVEVFEGKDNEDDFENEEEGDIHDVVDDRF